MTELRKQIKALSNEALIAEYKNATREERLFDIVSSAIGLECVKEAERRKLLLTRPLDCG